MKEEKRHCGNCGQFIKHFTNYSGYYHEVSGCGHCVCQALKRSERKKRRMYGLPCEFWEPMEVQVMKRRETLKECLRNMAKRIEEIALILKNDE